MKPGLGTQLRHLIELLDGAVSAAYEVGGLRYRPRYTPVMRALMVQDPTTVTQIAEAAGITQPAATQTVALMIREGLLSAEMSVEDNRRKTIRLTPYGRELLPRLEACWHATTAAADSLDAELPFPLSQLLDLAIDALAKKPFGLHIQTARQPRARSHSSKRTTKEIGKNR